MTDYSQMSEYTRHGGAYDRGAADSYYVRGPMPHYYTGATFNSKRIEEAEMSETEIAAYLQGFADNERQRNFKDWN